MRQGEGKWGRGRGRGERQRGRELETNGIAVVYEERGENFHRLTGSVAVLWFSCPISYSTFPLSSGVWTKWCKNLQQGPREMAPWVGVSAVPARLPEFKSWVSTWKPGMTHVPTLKGGLMTQGISTVSQSSRNVKLLFPRPVSREWSEKTLNGLLRLQQGPIWVHVFTHTRMVLHYSHTHHKNT